MNWMRLYIVGRLARLNIRADQYSDDEIICVFASYVEDLGMPQIDQLMAEFEDEEWRIEEKKDAYLIPRLEFAFMRLLNDRESFDAVNANSTNITDWWNKLLNELREG